MTGVRTWRTRASFWGALVAVALMLAPLGFMAWNGYSLLAHRRDAAAQMRAVLEEHGEVLDVDLGSWQRAPTGSLCEALVQMTARLDVPAERVLPVLEARVRGLVEGVDLRGAPGHVLASALLLHHGEFALFGCS